MKARNQCVSAGRISAARSMAVLALGGVMGLLATGQSALAAERQFLVILANSPKQFPNSNGQPPAGLPNPQDIKNQYFNPGDNPNIGSFAEYWEEISYGDVTVGGTATDWLNLPWPIQPPAVIGSSNSTPALFYDLNLSAGYDYGAGEPFSNTFASGTSDMNGDPSGVPDGPFGEDTGSGHRTALGAPVWKPGERFVDMDGDGAWDGLDEANNEMDSNGDGKPDLRGPWIDLNANRAPDNSANCVFLPDSDNDGNPDCCPDGPGKPGCKGFFFAPEGAEVCPPTAWATPGGAFNDCNGNLIPDVCDFDPNLSMENSPTAEQLNAAAAAANACQLLIGAGVTMGDPLDFSRDVLPIDDDMNPQPDGIPDECQITGATGDQVYSTTLVCFDESEDVAPTCLVPDGFRPMATRCEYDDNNRDMSLDIVEPFENFIRRWEPCARDPDRFPTSQRNPQTHWIKVYDPFSTAPSISCPGGPTINYKDPSYIRDNYPGRRGRCTISTGICTADDECDCVNAGPDCIREQDVCFTGVDELIAEAGGRLLFGSHDPLRKLQMGNPIADCVCADLIPCGDDGQEDMIELYNRDGIFNITFPSEETGACALDAAPCTVDDDCRPGDVCVSDPAAVPDYCVVGWHRQWDPSDSWIDVTIPEGPDGEVVTTKMQAAVDEDDAAEFVPAVRTPQPTWYRQAWLDRYPSARIACDSPQPPTPCEPPWPTGAENIPVIEPFADADPDGFEADANRRYFHANAGGTSMVDVPGNPNSMRRTGIGIGWVECADTETDPVVLFETGAHVADVGIEFEALCDAPILPEERDGEGMPGIFFDGWVEHDDLPSSKYHRAGDERLGEVTSPFNDQIYGHDRGPSTPFALPFPDNVIDAAGPYATNIHGNFGFDGGNLLTMELLTWRNAPPFNDAVQWEEGTSFDPEGSIRSHPFAGPGTLGLGFRDFNLDGLIDLGETRFGGGENYIVDSLVGTPNNGTLTSYPFNRRRLLEDCIEVLDAILDFDDFIDTIVQARIGTRSTAIPASVRGQLDANGNAASNIASEGINSGIVLLPNGSHGGGDFPLSPGFYAIHNEDSSNPATRLPKQPTGSQTINWNIFFHDLVIQTADPGSPNNDAQTAYSSHEYLHAWEGFPDLYDYDVFDTSGNNLVINTPVGRWDIMSGSERVPTSQVHSVPLLKEKPRTQWLEPVDLTTVVTPGVDATITIPPYELVRDNSAFFLENENRNEGFEPGLGPKTERFYFYSVGRGVDVPGFPGFGNPSRVTGGYPGTGMLILHTDVSSNPDGLAPAQFQGPRFEYLVVQADGRAELDAGVNPFGDASDPWPGTLGRTRFNFDTLPAATWYSQSSWTGIDVLDVIPDGTGSVQLQINWVPTSIPSLRFIDPPGGASVNGRYTINFDATDVFGGTMIEMYFSRIPDDADDDELFDPNQFTVPSPLTKIGPDIPKDTPGTRRLSAVWPVAALADGRYFLFAKLKPGIGADGVELRNTLPRKGRNNVGNGTMSVNNVDIEGNKARSETWTAKLIDIQTDGTLDWVVNSTISQVAPPDRTCNATGGECQTDGDCPGAETCEPTVQAACRHFLIAPTSGVGATYNSCARHCGGNGSLCFNDDDCAGSTACLETVSQSAGDSAVSFRIVNGAATFAIGDSFSFTTTGITAASRSVSLTGGEINEDPTAKIFATPLAGPPPLAVSFDGRDSFDPNGQALTFEWTFGDGAPQVVGNTANHTYNDAGSFTAKLRVTNAVTGRFGETAVDIEVTNNSPRAKIVATPTSGGAPLTVQFDGSQSTDQETRQEDLIYEWDFGDGSTANDAGDPGVSIDTDHFFTQDVNGNVCSAADPCLFIVKLTVTDGGGKKDTVSMEISVGNTNPVPIITHTSLQGTDPHEVIFNALNSTDAEGQDLTVTWMWDADNPADTDTFPVEGPNGDGNVVHEYTRRSGESSSSFKTTAIVEDSLGGKTPWAGVTVLVSDRFVGASDPVAAFIIDPDPPVLNEPFNADARLSFDRPSGLPDRFVWDFGDNSPAIEGQVVEHTYTESGLFTIKLTVFDRETPPNSAQRTKTVRVGADAGPDTSTNRRPNAVINVNETQGIAGVTEFTFDARNSTDADGDTLTYVWNLGGERRAGAVVAKVFDEPGEFVVTLTATDTSSVSDDATIRITIISGDGNRDPLAIIGTGRRTGTAPLILTFDGQASFDPDGDAITYRWEFILGGVLFDDATGPVVTQMFPDAGTYQVVLEVSDGRGGVTRTAPEIVQVTARGTAGDGGGPVEPPPEQTIPDSGAGRPGAFCAMGILPGFFASLIGLSLLGITRRRTAKRG